MNLKNIFQIFLIILIFVILFLVYKNYFLDDKIVKIQQKNEKIEIEKSNGAKTLDAKDKDINTEEAKNNILENIEYRSTDIEGNKFILKAKKGEMDSKKINSIKLEEVSAIILVENKSPLYIFSTYATYEPETKKTEFYGLVKLRYENNVVDSKNLDLDFANNEAIVYNGVVLNNDSLKMNADKVLVDFIEKEISINMFNEDQKISIVTKEN